MRFPRDGVRGWKAEVWSAAVRHVVQSGAERAVREALLLSPALRLSWENFSTGDEVSVTTQVSRDPGVALAKDRLAAVSLF